MANESFQKLVNEINEGMEQVKQISASSSGDQKRLLERMLGSYDEAQSILRRIAREEQPESVISSSSSKTDKILMPLSGSKKSRVRQKQWSKQVRVASEHSVEDDGYAWRKYGQKAILNSKYPRSYYRCTHKYSGHCLATKIVRRSDDDPCLLDITYNGVHTCDRLVLEAPTPVSPGKQNEFC